MSSTFVSFAALVISVLSLVYTQSRTDKRDISKWRREELQKLTSSLMQASTQRQNGLNDELWRMESGGGPRPEDEPSCWELTARMLFAAEQLTLFDDQTARAARAVYELHRETERKYYPSEDPHQDTGQLLVTPEDGLAVAHHKLVQAFQEATQTAARGRRRVRSLLSRRRELE